MLHSLRCGSVFEAVEPRRMFAISFSPAVPTTLQGLTTVAAADFNHDGRADIVARGQNDAQVHFFAGTGDGHFTATNAATPVYAGQSVVSLVTGDFNRDGELDFAAANSRGSANTGSIAVLLGNGNGTFQPAKFYAAGPDPTGLATADVNRDGRLDLIASNNGTWAANTGDSFTSYGAAILLATNSGFSTPVRVPLSFPSTAVAVGATSLASLYSTTNTTPVLAFAGPNIYSAAPIPMTFVALVSMSATTAVPVAQFSVPGTNNGLASTGLNRDRLPDFAALQVLGSNVGANTSTHVYTVSSRATVTAAESRYALSGPFTTGLDSGFGIAAADFDLNGVGDVVVAGTRSLGPMLPAFVGSVSALAGDGTGALRTAKSFDVGGTPSAIAVARLDKDTAPDVVTTNSRGVAALINARSVGPRLTAARELPTVREILLAELL